MYNRYISGAWPDPPEPSAAPVRPEAAKGPEPAPFPADNGAGDSGSAPVFEPMENTALPAESGSKGLGGLKSLFGGNIKLPEFNADTILLLVMVYFLVSDDSENISDTLLIVGVLLLLGF